MKKINDLHTDRKFKTILSLILLVVLSFSAGNKLNAQTVSGPTLVCTTAQYTVNCYCTVTWTCSSELTLISGQGTTTATFSANDNGLGWVKAKWGTEPDAEDDQDVWVGPPNPPIYVTSETYTYGYAGNWYSFTIYPYNPNQYSEAVDNIYGGDDTYDFGGNYWSIYFEYEGLYQIWATNSNTCGESDPVYMYYLGPREGIEFGFDIFDE